MGDDDGLERDGGGDDERHAALASKMHTTRRWAREPRIQAAFRQPAGKRLADPNVFV
jgi:hypothetical protein